MENKLLELAAQIEKPSIAIIGVACRFPDARNYEEYWKNNKEGKNSVKRIGYDRWKMGKHVCPDDENSGWNNDKVVKYCATLDDIDKFDDAFFHISPREAKNMDPQQRLLLEETWHCVEDAGVSLEELQKTPTSVYVGASGNDYEFVALSKGEKIDSYASVGNFQSILSNRISHQFNLSGESMTLDTACSSSLVAIHRAKESLVNREAGYAIAAGVCLAYLPWRYITFSKSNMMSVDGQCKAFDKNANGFIQGEGVGVLLLQRLEDAIRDKNHIYGIIKGSAVNHCGASQTITAPSMQAQSEVIKKAFSDALIEPKTVNYVETHGTGTALGDPIEIEALRRVFEKNTSEKQFCTVGSVKTNIGHLASASGVAGVIRVLEMMKHKQIPKTLNLEELNPLLDWKSTPFRVTKENIEWNRVNKDTPLRAGVSGFGFGGVNAHIILEEYENDAISSSTSTVQEKERVSIFTINALNEQSLLEKVESWKKFIEEKKQLSVEDICKTLLNSRKLEEGLRVGAVVKNVADIKQFIAKLDVKKVNKLSENIAFTLRVSNMQYSGYDEISSILELPWVEKELQKHIKELGRLIKTKNKKFLSLLKEPTWNQDYAGKLSFVVNYIIVKAFLSLNINVNYISCTKESFLLAATICNMIPIAEVWKVLSNVSKMADISLLRPMIPLEDPVSKKVWYRYLIDQTFMDEMIFSITFLQKDLETLEYYVNKAIQIKETQFTYKKYLEEWDRCLKDTGITVDSLLKSNLHEEKDDHRILLVLLIAYGSLIKLNKKWDLSESKYFVDERITSIVQLLLDEVISKERIAKALLDLDGQRELLQNELKEGIKKIKEHSGYAAYNKHQNQLVELDAEWISAFDKQDQVELKERVLLQVESRGLELCKMTNPVYEELLHVLLNIWEHGGTIQWSEVYPLGSYQRLALPTYSFQKKSFWIALDNEVDKSVNQPMIDFDCSKDGQYLYVKKLDIADFYVGDHIVDDKVILPGVAYLEMAREAGTLAIGKEVTEIKDISWINRMEITSTKDAYVSLQKFEEQDVVKFSIYTQENKEKKVHAVGKLSCMPIEKPQISFSAEEVKNRCTYNVTKDYCYQHVFADVIGFKYGKGFQVTQQAFGAEEESLELLELPSFLEGTFDQYVLHPSILDAALRAITWIGDENAYRKLHLHIPFSLGSVKIYGRFTKKNYSYAKIVQETKEKESGARQYCISIFNENGELVMEAQNFIIREIRKKNPLVGSFIGTTQWMPKDLYQKRVNQVSVVLLLEQSNEHPYRDSLKHAWGSEPITLVQVFRADVYKKLDETTYHIREKEAEDYRRLLKDLEESGYLPDEIIHMWCKSRGQEETITTEQMQDSFYSLCNCFLAAMKECPQQKVNMRVLIPEKNLEQKSTSQWYLPDGGMIQAFAKSVASVHANVRIGVIHYVGEVMDARLLVDEMKYSNGLTGEEIAYRDGVRKERVCVSLELSKAMDTSSDKAIPYRKNGVYLITGGLGKIGIRCAQYLCNEYAANVILLGRSELSEDKQKRFDTVKAYSGTVTYYSCDITDGDRVKFVIEEVVKTHGTIHGIIHCAGVLGTQDIVTASKEEMDAVLNPKVKGTVNLDLATKDIELDFMMLYSSISAMIGDFGRGTYAAGNGFMDSFSEMRDGLREQGLRSGICVSVNWPIWLNSGMELAKEEAYQYYELSHLKGLSLDQGMEVMTKCLAARIPHVVFGYGEPERVKRIIRVQEEEKNVIKQSAPSIVSNQVANTTIEIKTEQTGVSKNQEQLSRQLITYLKEVLSKATGVAKNEVEEETDFSKYGIDSIMILDLNELLEEDFSNIPKTLFFEYSNIKELAEFFLDYDLDGVKKAVHFETTGFADEIIAGVSPVNVEQEMEQVKVDEVKEEPIKGKVEMLHHSQPHKVEGLDFVQTEDIAIVGLDGKYPMAENLNIFWENLKEGKDCITEIPKERWDGERDFDFDKTKKNKVYSKWGGFLDGVEKFDPTFFQMTPREAELIDPQERLMLESAYKTIEDAGYDKKNLAGKKVGVFVGVMNSQYQLYGAMEYMRGNLYDVHSSFASIANRISYFFDFHGPSIAMDTMCSSALTAIHLACESIHRGECEMALAGSVNAILHPAKYIFLSEQRFGSSEGRCRAFGEGGDGYVPGEGVGAILLKPLSKAEKDKDHIYGVIKATAMNHGGKVSSYTVPNPKEQAAVIEECIRKSGVNPRYISYIEAHGTGTKLGDPIEIAGLSKAFGKYTKDTEYCAIGSVKSNIGHLESAAGMASLTKVLLQMKYKQLVPSILAEHLNTNIDFSRTPFYVQRELEEWKQVEELLEDEVIYHNRCAGISSFGAGGTNVHIIVEEYLQQDSRVNTETKEEEHLIVLSAKNKEFLKKQAEALADYLETNILGTQEETELVQPTLQKETVIAKLQTSCASILGIESKLVDARESLGKMGMDQVNVLIFKKQIMEAYPMFHCEMNILDKSIEQLAEFICKLFEKQEMTLIGKQLPQSPLSDIEYTLQVGREAFEERIAIISSSVQEIHDILRHYAEGMESQQNLYSGERIKEQSLKVLFQSEAGKEFKSKILQSNDKRQIAQMWLLNIEFDWEMLYDHKDVHRISLPCHIFDDKSYWIGKELLGEDWSTQEIQESLIEYSMSNTEQIDKEEQSRIETKKVDVQQRLKEIVGEIIYESPENIQSEEVFSAYGVTSVLAMELIEKVNEIFQTDFSVADLFSYTNIVLLSQQLEKRMQSQDSGEKLDMMEVMRLLEEGKIGPEEAEKLLGGI